MDLLKSGTKTPRTKLYKSESHKLCHAFPVASNEVINEAEPVALLANGTIKALSKLTAGEATSPYVGIATSFSNNNPYPSYPVSGNAEQTVMVSGFAITYGVAKTPGLTNAGYVKPTSAPITNGYTEYEPSATPTNFIALHPASTGGLVQILVK